MAELHSEIRRAGLTEECELPRGLAVLYHALPLGLQARVRALLLVFGRKLGPGLRVRVTGPVAYYIYSWTPFSSLGAMLCARQPQRVRDVKATLDARIKMEVRRAVDGVFCEFFDAVTSNGARLVCTTEYTRSCQLRVGPFFHLRAETSTWSRSGKTCKVQTHTWYDYVLKSLIAEGKDRLGELDVPGTVEVTEADEEGDDVADEEGDDVPYDMIIKMDLCDEHLDLKELFGFESGGPRIVRRGAQDSQDLQWGAEG
eukprot:Hpha_TRINITY_DN8388_c0_g2::TRINITY_DN8388_c0_g2_i1::g.154226::m.154226